jgi:hypothetical protein
MMRSRWKAVAASAALAGLACSSAVADARPDARRMSCDEAQHVVQQSGAVVMSTGEFTYERFVSNLGACTHGDILRPAWTATADQPQCPVGWSCAPHIFRHHFR